MALRHSSGALISNEVNNIETSFLFHFKCSICFVVFVDREVTSPDIVPSPASEFRDPLMYVAININKRYWCPAIAKQNAIMGIPPNRDQKRRQHWFAVPRER